MKLKSLIFILLLALGASALHATEISDKIPAYCITYPTDSSYEIHLVNHPNFFSNNDKKIEIKYGTFINFPRNLDSPIYPINFYHLKNAKEILPKFYGQTFRGSQSKTEEEKRDEQEFDALLLGTCEKSIPVARYCLMEGVQPALYRTDLFENVPKTYFFDTDTLSDIVSSHTFRCSGTARMSNTTEWDFAKIGKFALNAFTDEDSCHGQSMWFTLIEAFVPKYIDFSSDTSFKVTTRLLREFYGKNIPITWDLSMECGFEKIQKHIEYEIRFTGKCPLQINSNKNKTVQEIPWRIILVDIHGRHKDPYDKCFARTVHQ